MPMLDRRIAVRRTEFVTDENTGETTERVTDYPMWATRRDDSFIDAATESGQLQTATRTYTIRYREDLASFPVAELIVVDGGIELSADNLLEAEGERGERRRFLRIEATGEVTV